MCKGTVSYMLCDQGSSERPLELIRRLWYPIVSPLEEEEWRPLCFMFEGHTLAHEERRRAPGDENSGCLAILDDEERKEGKPRKLYLRGLTARRNSLRLAREGRRTNLAEVRAKPTDRLTDQMTARPPSHD